jgi:hypothetical protein
MTKIIGFAGPAGAGKDTAASFVPGAVTIHFADPLYAMLSVMLGVPECALRDRNFKERIIPWIGKSPRQLLQTLGTEWGRDVIGPDLWVRVAMGRVDALAVPVVCIPDVRFANESDWIRAEGGKVFYIRNERDGRIEVARHKSEESFTEAMADGVIVNDGPGLQMKVLEAIAAV